MSLRENSECGASTRGRRAWVKQRRSSCCGSREGGGTSDDENH